MPEYNGDPFDWIMRMAASDSGHRLRPREIYGDVTLSVQASETHYCSPQEGDASVPLEHYATVEVAMWWTSENGPRGRWITKPSKELGIDGFDDLWNDDDVAGWVPLPRVGALQMALSARAARLENAVL